MKNKVKYGLQDVHWAGITENENGVLSYGTPRPWPGAVNLNLPPKGDKQDFYADNGVYWGSRANDGYEGTFESAMMPDEFKIAHLGYRKDSKGVVVENSEGKESPFALLFQFEGDVKAIRHVLYYCKASRANLDGETQNNQKTPKTDSIPFEALRRPDTKDVKSYADPETDATVYKDWYKAVYEPDPAETEEPEEP